LALKAHVLDVAIWRTRRAHRYVPSIRQMTAAGLQNNASTLVSADEIG
jgi:hypothetical protein